MSSLKFLKGKNKFDVKVGHGKNNMASYHSVIDKDPNNIAQVLIDLAVVYNYPIDKAIRIYKERMYKKDWIGL